MYKVFYKDRTVFFIENIKNSNEITDSDIHNFRNKKHLKAAINSLLNNSELKNLCVVHKNINKAFRKFTQLYKLIEAAGGLVKNSSNEVLVIYRRGKWDLPKGKLERNESPEIGAIREVEEECGIENIKIKNYLETTYHTYKLQNKDILKRTFWYEMTHKGNQEPTPQIEEEITEAKWISTEDLDEVLNNTFPSIIEVFKKGNVI
ncbi:NUDIX hydrolase [Bacteroidota bacterium]